MLSKEPALKITEGTASLLKQLWFWIVTGKVRTYGEWGGT